MQRAVGEVPPAGTRSSSRRGRFWMPATAVLLGVAAGLGLFTFVYAKGYSYFGSNPATCANCHIMEGHYSAWLASSHAGIAGCNDCHTPHEIVGKYATKARNGFWHSFYFTTGRFPYPLRITERNHAIVEGACRDCHAQMVAAMNAGTAPAPDEVRAHRTAQGVECTHCHRHVGHWIR
ncbi:MAG: cytochrome c nitrite reductase small subunit [Candidatus Eisenbacteria bacterium]